MTHALHLSKDEAEALEAIRAVKKAGYGFVNLEIKGNEIVMVSETKTHKLS